MKHNVEIKARIASVDSLVPLAARLAEQGPIEISQDDTFFTCPNGRLKLRVFSQGEGELIFYQRSDTPGPKESSYIVMSTSSPEALNAVLSSAYGQIGHVRKRRILFLVGRTRIHLDRVEGLGDFLELEVVLQPDEASEAGAAVANALLEKLGVSSEQLVKEAYVDLLAKK
jgi:predicted adenylyl cyclase CyaB